MDCLWLKQIEARRATWPVAQVGLQVIGELQTAPGSGIQPRWLLRAAAVWAGARAGQGGWRDPAGLPTGAC